MTQMTWDYALRDLLGIYQEGQGAYGTLDCCTLVAEYVYYLTSKNFMSGYDYDSEASAKWHIESAGGICGLMSRHLGEPSVVQPGSVVVVDIGADAQAPGIFNGHYVWIMHHERGLCRVPSSRIVSAWSVC